MDPRSQIERLKEDMRISLEFNSGRFNASIVRELNYLWRRFKSKDLSFEEFIATINSEFDIPANAKADIIAELESNERKIAEVWSQFFDDVANVQGLSENELEKLLALYEVDFPKIGESTRRIIVDEIRRTARAKAGIEVLRSRLKKRGVGDGETRTLANTALAQFDNASMFEFAKEAGIDKFKYDGVIHPNSRKFCQINCGKIFTLAEIMKMDNGQGLPVLTSLGGYNCTHFWTPIVGEAKVEAQVSESKPVSAAFEIVATKTVSPSVRRALKLIDSVHGDGELRMIPIRSNSSGFIKGEFRAILRKNDTLIPSDISISSKSDGKLISIAHEIGHFLDLDGIGEKGSYATGQGIPEMKEVLGVAYSTKAIKALQDTIPKSYKEDQFISYLLDPKEVWARAYSQYIATKSGDKRMLEQLALHRSATPNMLWQDDDFRPILKEIDHMFTKLGWMKP